ncbi:MAG: tetratricopeptide repeat protein [Steroidobacteraceae bacterium]|jgi:hypothetical protein
MTTEQHDPQSLSMGQRLLNLAAEAYADSAVDVAIKLTQLAVEQEPTANALMQLAWALRVAGDFDGAIGLYERILEKKILPADAAILLALGLTESERGNFGAALDYLWQVVALGGATDLTWFYIGSCYGMLRQFGPANEIFKRDNVLPLHDGRTTSTRLLRLPSQRSEVQRPSSGELPFDRDLSLSQQMTANSSHASKADIIHLVCCDSRYLSLFARALARSVDEKAGVNVALHFHVVNPGPNDPPLLETLRAELNTSIAWTTERTDFRQLDVHQVQTYFSCARYLVLPELLKYYKRPILVTDADQFIVKSLKAFMDEACRHDVSLFLQPMAHSNLLALISASICVANDTPRSFDFFSAVGDYCLERMTDPQAMAWHLDQAALAAVYLASADIDFFLIPPKTMISTMPRKKPAREAAALFWSVTYSVEANAQKLESEDFQSLRL